jgi:hypothetical protein
VPRATDGTQPPGKDQNDHRQHHGPEAPQPGVDRLLNREQPLRGVKPDRHGLEWNRHAGCGALGNKLSDGVSAVMQRLN